MTKNLSSRLDKLERAIRAPGYDLVVFTKTGESLEKYRIGPKTVIFIDDIPEDD